MCYCICKSLAKSQMAKKTTRVPRKRLKEKEGKKGETVEEPMIKENKA